MPEKEKLAGSLHACHTLRSALRAAIMTAVRKQLYIAAMLQLHKKALAPAQGIARQKPVRGKFRPVVKLIAPAKPQVLERHCNSLWAHPAACSSKGSLNADVGTQLGGASPSSLLAYAIYTPWLCRPNATARATNFCDVQTFGKGLVADRAVSAGTRLRTASAPTALAAWAAGLFPQRPGFFCRIEGLAGAYSCVLQEGNPRRIGRQQIAQLFYAIRTQPNHHAQLPHPCRWRRFDTFRSRCKL